MLFCWQNWLLPSWWQTFWAWCELNATQPFIRGMRMFSKWPLSFHSPFQDLVHFNVGMANRRQVLWNENPVYADSSETKPPQRRAEALIFQTLVPVISKLEIIFVHLKHIWEVSDIFCEYCYLFIFSANLRWKWRTLTPMQRNQSRRGRRGGSMRRETG